MTPAAPRDTPPAADGGQVDHDNPWPGLPSFRERDQELFFGREAETETLRRIVMRESTRATVLFGRSGLGKTSLLQAGLFPRLRRQGVLPVPIRLAYGGERGPVDQVRDALRAAAAAANVEAPVLAPGETLWESLHRAGANFWSASNRIVVPLLVFDQFEEIFTRGRQDPEGCAAFLAELADLVEGRPPAAVRERLDAAPAQAVEFTADRHDYKILLSLRQDFLADLDRWRARMRSLGASRLALLHMNGEAALSVVLRPGGHLIEPEVAERLVRFVAGAARQPGEAGGLAPMAELEVDPTLLSLICRELNNRRRERGEPCITFDLLSGSWREILAGFYESSLAGLAPAVRTFVEDRLLTRSGYRDSVAWDNAVAAPGVTAADLLTLRDRRLLHFEERHGVAWVELTHDVLTEVIGESREVRRQREARREAEAALREADERERQTRERERDAQQRERATRRLLDRSRRLTVVLAAVLLAAVVLGGLVLRLWRRSDAAERRAERALLDSAGNLIEKGRDAQAMAYLASIMRSNPRDDTARSRALALLLNESWPLPVQVVRERRAVTSAQLSPDGERLLTAAAGGTVRLWRVRDGAGLGEMRLGDEQPTAAFSPDGNRILTAGRDSLTVRLWDGRTAAPLGGPIKADVFSRSGSAARPVLFDAAWSPRGDRILIRSSHGSQLFDSATGRPVPSPVLTRLAQAGLYLKPGPAAFSPDGARLLVAGRGDHSLLWVDLRTGEGAGELLLPELGWLASIGFSPRGDRLFTIDSAATVQVWDLATRRAVAFPHKARVDAAEISPDGQTLLTTAADRTVRLWSLAAPAAPAKLLQHDRYVLGAQFSPDGRWVLTASRDGAARLWDARVGELMVEPLVHTAPVDASGFSRDGLRAVTAADDGTVKVWDLRVDHYARPYELPGRVESALFVPRRNGLIVVMRDRTARWWDLGTGANVALAPAGRALAAVVPLQDGRLATITFDARSNSSQVWDGLAGRPLSGPIPGPPGEPLTYLAVSPDGSRLLQIGGPGRRAEIRDLRTGRQVLTDPAMQRGQRTFSPDGRFLMAAGPTKAWLWDTATGLRSAEIVQPHGRSFGFAGGGKLVVAITQDRHLNVFALPDGRRVGPPWQLEGFPWAVDTGQDGNRALVNLNDGEATVGERGQTRCEFHLPLLTGSDLRFTSSISADGRKLLTRSAEGLAEISDAGSCQWLTQPLWQPLPSQVRSASFSPDGERVLTLDNQDVARVWDLPDTGAADSGLLADLAEAVGGFEVDRAGNLVPLRNQVARLAVLRAHAARPDHEPSLALRVVRWFFAEPSAFTLSPLSTVRVPADPAVAAAATQPLSLDRR